MSNRDEPLDKEVLSPYSADIDGLYSISRKASPSTISAANVMFYDRILLFSLSNHIVSLYCINL